MKLVSINIDGVAGVHNLSITFDPQMNILCGPNGIGKTTVLESIAHCFANGETNVLKRNLKSPKAKISAELKQNGQALNTTFEFNQFEPNQRANISGCYQSSQYLLSLKTNRTFSYVALNVISKDSEKPNHTTWEESKNGVALNDVKNWFVNRFLYSKHENTLTNAQLENFELAKRCFSVLNDGYSFSRVSASTNEILVNTPNGEIYYEYLSSGFKSCLSILFGIIKEIEFRFPEEEFLAQSFEGIVLIDEVELHLHPEWQYKITEILTTIFPAIQFVITTHSPHVIQSANRNQILALELQDEKVSIRDLPLSEFGFKGWSLDEILVDVMGMQDTRNKTYVSLFNSFNKAVIDENVDDALMYLDKLNSSLHPSSHIRKLLRLQFASIKGLQND